MRQKPTHTAKCHLCEQFKCRGTRASTRAMLAGHLQTKHHIHTPLGLELNNIEKIGSN